jgi:hypothetical protein
MALIMAPERATSGSTAESCTSDFLAHPLAM